MATTSIWRIILDAYGVTQYQISGGPAWLDSELYDFDARSTDPNAGKEQLRLMLQKLLSERCNLTLHKTTKEMPVYLLTVGKKGLGPMLKKEGTELGQSSRPGNFAVMVGRGLIGDLAERISNIGVISGVADVDRPVLDKTGLQGNYVWSLNWVDAGDFPGALEDEAGLKLESQRAQVESLVIDHVERPTEN